MPANIEDEPAKTIAHRFRIFQVCVTVFHTGSRVISATDLKLGVMLHSLPKRSKSANEVVTNLFSRRWPMVAADNCIAAQHHLLCAVKSWEDWDLIIQEPGADHDQQPDTTTGKT